MCFFFRCRNMKLPFHHNHYIRTHTQHQVASRKKWNFSSTLLTIPTDACIFVCWPRYSLGNSSIWCRRTLFFFNGAIPIFGLSDGVYIPIYTLLYQDITEKIGPVHSQLGLQLGAVGCMCLS